MNPEKVTARIIKKGEGLGYPWPESWYRIIKEELDAVMNNGKKTDKEKWEKNDGDR